MSDRIKVVKIGGNVVDNSQALSRFLADFKRLSGPKILVHGGGKEATRLSAALGIETKMIDGRRVTDSETLSVVTMVYAGLINKRIVSLLQAEGVDAIGMCGADANIITAKRRNPEPVDYGFVGDIDPLDVNESVFSLLFKEGVTPVICAIMHDGAGQLLNCNADSVAGAVAVASSRINPVDLVYCFEKPGVLSEPDDDSSVIRHIDSESYAQLRADGVISRGMIPKIDNAMAALRGGVSEVYIKSADNLLNSLSTVVTL